MKDKTLLSLVRSLIQAGVINAQTENGGRQTVKYWIRYGKLTLRKRPHSQWNVVNDEEIAQIISAFSPGGKGEWHFPEGDQGI